MRKTLRTIDKARRTRNLILLAFSPLLLNILINIFFSKPQDVPYNDRNAPNIYSAEIMANRDYADIYIISNFERFEEITNLDFIASGRDERCWEGQNGWKSNDGYAYRCAKKSTRVYRLYSTDIRTDLLVIDGALKTNDWKSDDDGYDYLIPDYYDEYTQDFMEKFVGKYTVSSMPSAQYYKKEYGLKVDILDSSFLKDQSNDESSWLHGQEVDYAGFWTSYIESRPIPYETISSWNFDNGNYLVVVQSSNIYYSY